MDSDTTFTLPNETLMEDKIYYWRVQGKNEGGEAMWSNVYHFKTFPTPPEPVRLLVPKEG